MKRTKSTRAHLLANYFTAREAGEFSILPIKDPVLKVIVRDRLKRRRDFERRAVNLLDRGKWRDVDIEQKWTDNLATMYRSRGWMVKYGPTGLQPRMEPGTGNPWAMYRHFEPLAPTKRHVSPWQLRRYPGKTQLQRGLIFVQKLERGKAKATYTQLAHWIHQKREAIRKARGPRKAQLRVELRRLEVLYAKAG